MDRRRSATVLREKLAWPRRQPAPPLAPAIYRDLVAPLFTMRLPIIGFGFLYFCVSALILLRWPDPTVFVLLTASIVVTTLRVMLLNSYARAGGAGQPMPDLEAWERRYAVLTFVMAALLAGLNLRVLMVHEPLLHMAALSLVFTFGAGVVSRTSSRPRMCSTSLLIAVVPTAAGLLAHAATMHHEPLHAGFFLLLALLILAVMGMSLDSVRHLHAATLEQVVTKHDLAKLARYDALTGLPNRLLLREAFHDRLAETRQAGTQLAVHYLDLDGFKAINDGYGHPIGDRMLCEVARRMLATIRTEDTAFRLGGDEFVIIQAAVSHRDEAELLARRVIKHLSEPYVFDGTEMRISVSIGIAMADDPAAEFDALVAAADAALYCSKARGKSQLQFSDAAYPEPGRSAA